jgi:quinohemoprotein ethanol dehydrogenase
VRGGGDSLYTASILAVRAATGDLAWHFQTTPGDNWDFDATQPLLQADLTIGGRARKVIMQANKNGFFYVLDRATGEFVSGAPFVSGITWASGLNPKSGRPVESQMVQTAFEPFIVSPSPDGAHNWNPMAFSPSTGFVYVPAKVGTQSLHAPDSKWKYNADWNNIGGDDSYDGPLNAKFDNLPAPAGELVAWDPVAQKAAWRASYPVMEGGGVLATGGNLVFQGRSDGVLAAWRATDGKPLWTFDAATGIMAPPVTYMVDGVQYLSVLAGWGGPSGLFNGSKSGPVKPGYGRILTFKLDGTAVLKAPALLHKAPPEPMAATQASPQTVKEGGRLYGARCAFCHGFEAVAGALPDLRYSSRETIDGLDDIVLRGTRAKAGMPSFARLLDPGEVRAIQAYIVSRNRAAANP